MALWNVTLSHYRIQLTSDEGHIVKEKDQDKIDKAVKGILSLKGVHTSESYNPTKEEKEEKVRLTFDRKGQAQVEPVEKTETGES